MSFYYTRFISYALRHYVENQWKYDTVQDYYKINAYYNAVSLTLLQWLAITMTTINSICR
jgi:hypothetical protein